MLRSITKFGFKTATAYSFARFVSYSIEDTLNPNRLSAFRVFQARFLNEEDCRQRNITPQTLFKRATSCISEGGFINKRRAKKSLKRMLKFNPTEQELNLYEAAGDAGKRIGIFGYVDSHSFYSKAYNNGLRSSDIAIKIGQCKLMFENYNNAREFFAYAQELDVLNPAPYNWLGVSYIVEGTREDCINQNELNEKANEFFSKVLKYTYSLDVQENRIVASAMEPALYWWLTTSREFFMAEPNDLVSITRPVLKALDYGKTSTQSDSRLSPGLTFKGDFALVATSVSIDVPNPNNYAAIRRINRKVNFFHHYIRDDKQKSQLNAQTFLTKLLQQPSAETETKEAIHSLLAIFQHQSKDIKIPEDTFSVALKVDSREQGYPVTHALIKLGMPITKSNILKLNELGIQLDEIQLNTIASVSKKSFSG